MASGGILAMKVINERPKCLAPGSNPMFNPSTRPTAAADPMPIKRRFKLALVSLDCMARNPLTQRKFVPAIKAINGFTSVKTDSFFQLFLN